RPQTRRELPPQSRRNGLKTKRIRTRTALPRRSRNLPLRSRRRTPRRTQGARTNPMRPGDDPTAETTDPPAQQPDEEPAATKKSEPTGSETAEKVANKPATPVAIARKPVATPTAKQEPEEPNLQEYKADTKTTVKPLAPI